MSQLKQIVAATDLSAASRHAVDRAATLAQAFDAQLTLAHSLVASALDDLRRWVGSPIPVDAIEEEVRTQLKALAGQLHDRHGARVDERVLCGHPVREICRLAAELDAELLVTGTRGAGFFRGVVVGSTAERVATRTARPVLMVRQSVHEPYRRALVPVDFSPWSLDAVRLAHRVAPQARLVLMHAVEVPFEGRIRMAGVPDATIARYRDEVRLEAQHRLHQLADEAQLAPERVSFSTPTGGDPWMLIAQEEQEQDCELIVMGRQGRNAFEELLLGSTTRMVLSECAADVLVSTAHRD
jgi:nucleotide-binding universal stress UspA family protein